MVESKSSVSEFSYLLYFACSHSSFRHKLEPMLYRAEGRTMNPALQSIVEKMSLPEDFPPSEDHVEPSSTFLLDLPFR
jgi:hypothetical protein